VISPTLVYDPTSEIVARALITAGAYRITTDSPPDQWFKWKSGILAPVYTDCRVLAGHPGECAIVRTSLGSSIRANFPHAEYIVGMSEAGIIWATLAGSELAKPFAFVRKQKKGHGASAGFVECSPPVGARAVVVDDLVASGESLEHAIRALKEEKDIKTIGVQSIVNWDFLEMRDRFRNFEIPTRALVSFPSILRAAVEASMITERAMEELTDFYRSPRSHKWNLEAFARTLAS